MLVFEQPLNERVRLYLKLEALFDQFEHHASQHSAWDTRCAINTIIDICNMTSRGDIKLELIKELEKQLGRIKALSNSPGVDQRVVEHTSQELEMCIGNLKTIIGNINSELSSNDFLSSLKQKYAASPYIYSFDMPAFDVWLSLRHEIILKDLTQWFKHFESLKHGVELVLQILRESVNTKSIDTEQGFYQQNIESDGQIQLIRVFLEDDMQLYPEISGGRHRFSIRFFNFSNIDERPKQTSQTVSFKLALCYM